MTETRETYQAIHREYMAIRADLQAEFAPPDIPRRLAELETIRIELLETITYLEERHRKLLHQNQQLKEAAWSVLAVDQSISDDAESDRFELALRSLATLIDFPVWWNQ